MSVAVSYRLLLRLQYASGGDINNRASLIRLGGQMLGGGHLGSSSCSNRRSMASAACCQLKATSPQDPGLSCHSSLMPMLQRNMKSSAALQSRLLPTSSSCLAGAHKHTVSSSKPSTIVHAAQRGNPDQRKVQPLRLLSRDELEALRHGQQPQQKLQSLHAQQQQQDEQVTAQLKLQQPQTQLPTSPTQQEVLAHLQSMQQQSGPTLLNPQQLAAVAQYLAELNQEQWDAVRHPAQHLRLIAGPGSGKTRTMAARVAYLIATGQAEPHEILAITFTRKAAGELVERMEALMGRAIVKQLRPCTFHALCNNLLRKHQGSLGLEGFTIATEEDSQDVIKAVAAAMGAKDVDVKVLHKEISKIKNFTPRIEGRTGTDLVTQMRQSGLNLSPKATAVLLATVYDKYQEQLCTSNMLDFDDLLHRCLDLLHNDKQVRAGLHSRYKHVLVDESQDTNYCQFDLVTTITGARSTLFMVGDPDQAIYAFRGANSDLLTDVFSQHYKGTADTLFLSRNYRSSPPIVHAADMVRKQLLPATSSFQAGEPIRSSNSHETVILLEAENQFQEADAMVAQLKQWERSGYVWGEMALLFRTRDAAQFMYRNLIKADIPAHMPLGKDFWDTIEVKTAMALVRCLVQHTATGEVIKRRLVKKGGVQIPIMQGLGEATVSKLEFHVLQEASRNPSDTSSSSTLGSCLLGDCFTADMTTETAHSLLLQWLAAADGDTVSKSNPQSWMYKLAPSDDSHDVLLQLAPAWQPPAGYKGTITRKMKAVISRLRGLVVLARAAAEVHRPKYVLQLLLIASGVWNELLASSAGGDRDARRRINNLKVLIDLADSSRNYSHLLEAEEQRTAGRQQSDASDLSGDDTSDSDADGTSSSDTGGLRISATGQHPILGMPAVEAFYDSCVLRGEGGEESKDSDARVQLLTMHSSKGKEYPCVGVMRVYQGHIPSLVNDDTTPNALEQERNLLYVAMTRAKDHLVVSWPKEMRQYTERKGFDAKELTVSQFLRPLLRAADKLPGVVYHKLDKFWGS